MLDRKLYYDKPTVDRIRTRVVESGEEAGAPWVRLAETILHPEGGGQPSDRGTIGGAAVLDVREREGRVLHFLDRAIGTGEVEVVLDRARRDDLSRQHTAQHLLTAILLGRHDRRTTAFHLGDEYSAIEVTGAAPSEEEVRIWEEEANAEIRRGAAVATRMVTPAEYDRLEVRSRGLPADHRGDIRLLGIEGIDLNTCGGTHVTNLSELQAIHIPGFAPARGGTRVRFLAGERVFAALRGHRRTERELRERLGAGPDDFAKVLDAWREERQEFAGRARALSRFVAESAAEMLPEGDSAALRLILPLSDPDLLKQVARHVLEGLPDATVALVGADPGTGDACFLVQSGPDGPEDVRCEGERIREALSARGGGRGRFFQGAGGRLPRSGLEGFRGAGPRRGTS